MSEVRILLRELDRDWHGTLHASSADRVIAALSADPVTLNELEAAVARFERRARAGRFFSCLIPGFDDEPYDAGLVVIDLPARLVVVDSTYSSPGLKGEVEYHDGECCTNCFLPYHLAEDWKILRDGSQWRHEAAARRRERTARPDLDARVVLYGRPLLKFIARECLAAFVRREEIAAAVRLQRIEEARARLAKNAGILPEQVDAGLLTDEEITPKTWPGSEIYASVWYDTLSRIHAAWLLTPCDELDGASPREIALESHDHIVWDMQDRCHQWSMQHQCPPGLQESSHAFRLGGFGTHELVKYYDLVRELLWSCWNQLEMLARQSGVIPLPESLTAGDFLTGEISRLEAVREEWLDSPDPECHGRTPRSIISRERARLPEAVSGSDAMIDADCPCCQMMADLPGPMFWHLDGCNNDDDFAFDIHHRTREEWQRERDKWDEHNRQFNAKWAERERLGVAASDGAIWSRSYAIEGADVPVGVRVFGLGCRLAELIVGLRTNPEGVGSVDETQRAIDQLNRHFGNLRQVLHDPESSLASALLEPVLQRFTEELELVASERIDLAAQCDCLAKELLRLLEPPAANENAGKDDSDVPF
jgi:hypothetical protein